MVNFVRANADGAVGYQVYVDGAARTDQFNTAKWDGTQYQPVVISTMTIGGVADSYPVPSLTDLGLYIQSLPGCYLDSTTLSERQTLHTIEVSFFDGSGNLLETYSARAKHPGRQQTVRGHPGPGRDRRGPPPPPRAGSCRTTRQRPRPTN